MGHNNLLVVRISPVSLLSNFNVVLVENTVVVFLPFQLVRNFDVETWLSF